MKQRQRTLKSSFSLSGKGLHTGLDLTITIHPAPAGYGYKIRRVDLEGQPVIDALAENVKETTRGTVLFNGDVRCSTVEHGLASLYANGIDNVLIDVNGPEFPILDGSAAPYVEKILKTGAIEQDAEKVWLEVSEPIMVVDEKTGSRIALMPGDEPAISVTIDFNSHMMPMQNATLNNMRLFNSKIAAARTFVFVREIEPLLNLGLIKGGDLDNAIVIYERQTTQERMDKLCELCGVEHHDANELGYMQHKPLVWDNEPARHKLLDIIGDLSLVGAPIRGHIIATKPGHTINNIFARKLRDLLKSKLN